MRKLISSLMISAVAFVCYGEKTMVVIDGADRSPVVGASVISANGMIVGFTDGNGKITVEGKDFPLSFRSIGYEPLVAQESCDSVMLQPASYMLSELVISPSDRPITRILAYAREYCTGATTSDTLQMYNEYMLEFFYADGKVKGYDKSDESARALAVNRYGRIANSRGLDSIMSPRSDDEISTISFMTNMVFVPYSTQKETEAMEAGALIDTVQGKYYPKYALRKTGTLFTIDGDMLADFKDHKWNPWFFKLLGMTMELQQADWTLVYKVNDTGRYGVYDFIGGTYNMHILGKGKILRKVLGVKEAIGIDCMMDLYPSSIERLTVEEYKELKKDRRRTEEFRIPANVRPLPQYIENLVKRVNTEISQ